jgi:hypothetical protein
MDFGPPGLISGKKWNMHKFYMQHQFMINLTCNLAHLLESRKGGHIKPNTIFGIIIEGHCRRGHLIQKIFGKVLLATSIFKKSTD